jgi:hypothetical protein
MAIVGYFESLAEAQKLVQSELLAGVVQEIYEEGQLLRMLPVTTINSKSLLYNREKTLPSAAFYGIHEQVPWTAEANFTDQVEVSLKTVANQWILDRFIAKTYKNPNDYRTVMLSMCRKGVMRTIEDKLIYGNVDSDSDEFDGIGHLLYADVATGNAWTSTNPQAYDMAAGAVTLKVLRELIDVVRPKPTLLLMTRTMRNTLSATAFEKGLVLNDAKPLGHVTYAPDEFGRRVDYFDGVPIMISDYMVDETNDTVNKDPGNDSGYSSIRAIRFGAIEDGGLCLVTGGDTGGVEFFVMEELDTLEDYIAGGIKLYAFCSLAVGSTKALGVIHSIDEDGVIVG